MFLSREGAGGGPDAARVSKGECFMKRALVLSALTTVLLLTVLSGQAGAVGKPDMSDGAVLDDPRASGSRGLELERITAEKEAELGIGEGSGISIMSLNKYGVQTRPVTNYKQETTYYCGPASSRQSLSFHKSRSGSSSSLPSQGTLAGRIGTTTDGSATTGIVSALNSYSGTFGSIGYVASDITNTSNPYETFVNRIGTMLRSITQNPTAPIILVQTKYIPRYNKVASRHYMTVSGINDDASPMQMRSVDPHYSSAYYGVRWENVGSTTTNGLCRACYEADVAGSNKAMAW